MVFWVFWLGVGVGWCFGGIWGVVDCGGVYLLILNFFINCFCVF